MAGYRFHDSGAVNGAHGQDAEVVVVSIGSTSSTRERLRPQGASASELIS